MAPGPSTSWLTELGFRMRRHLLLKFAGTSLVTWLFFVAYFHVLRHPLHAATTMPVTGLDRAIPAWPLAVVPYLSLWLYVGIAPGLQRTFRELLVYGGWAASLCAVGLAVFRQWPTRIPDLAIDGDGMPGFALLRGIDTPGNACPSMHVAIALFTAIWVDVLLRECRVPIVLRLANAAWFVAIAYSTVAIRQHVLIDVVAGAGLGAAFAIPSLRWRGRRASVTFASVKAIRQRL